ncbi:small basic protein [Carboxydothermus islandicus]|uniref:Small basic protein n=2 Tax=Carboxydothermus islandicus TaxID=661089 RepID=A0A1L8D3J4_9THEO|nr:small basic protein [Carboxydothermus islandicus]
MIGIVLGLLIPLGVPIAYSKYLSVALLAALDSVFGGVRANMENNYDNVIFITGFFSNTLLAGILAWIGERMGVELYTAAIFVFGVRIFQNLAIIRRHLLKR